MIKNEKDVVLNFEYNEKGIKKMSLSDLRDFEGINPKIEMYSHVKLNAGEKVNFHMHIGECEIYYILKGKALYDDNGEKVMAEEGTVTFTPSGSGHGIENVGDDVLEFMALVIKD